MKRHVFRIVLMLAILASTFLSTPDRWVSAATFRNHIAQVPAVPTSAQSVRVWMQSDTAFGETAGIEYNIGSSFVKVLGTFDTSGHPRPTGVPIYPPSPMAPSSAINSSPAMSSVQIMGSLASIGTTPLTTVTSSGTA